MSDKLEIIDNMSDARVKSRTIAQVAALQKVWRITMVRYRPRRTDRQNRFYHPAFVAPFADYLREHGNEITNEEAHEILKAKFLTVSIIDKITGEKFDFVRSTTSLNTVEFNHYLDRIALMFVEECRLTVPDPSIYREPVEDSQ